MTHVAVLPFASAISKSFFENMSHAYGSSITQIELDFPAFIEKKNSIPASSIIHIHRQGWTNFFLGARLFGRAKNEWSKPKCTSDLDTIKDIAFSYLLPKQNLHLSF